MIGVAAIKVETQYSEILCNLFLPTSVQVPRRWQPRGTQIL